MSYTLQKLFSEYNIDVDKDTSPTLNSLYLKSKNFSNDIAKVNFTNILNNKIIENLGANYENDNYILYEYLKNSIDSELSSDSDYFTFYSTQSLEKYINSRVIDYLINDKGKTLYYLYNGKASILPINELSGGKYKNTFTFLQFLNKYIIDKCEQIKDVSPFTNNCSKEAYNLVALELNKLVTPNLLITELQQDPSDLQLKEMLNLLRNVDYMEIYETLYNDNDIFNNMETNIFFNTYLIKTDIEKLIELGTSLDARNTSISNNLYSINNTAIGNSFYNESIGESSLKFFLTKYASQYNNEQYKINLKEDIMPFIVTKTIDDTILQAFIEEIKKFITNNILNVGSKYPTKLAILYKISIKKDCIYKYAFPSEAYCIPLITHIDSISFYNTTYKDNITKFYNILSNINILNDNKDELDIIYKLLNDKNNNIELKKNNENKIPQTALDYLTVYQGRLVLTDEWITGIKNDEIKISVFPCNYNSIKPECTDFVKLLDVIIKEFTDKLKQTHNVNIDVIKKKYMKYKMKYLQLKQR